MIRILMGSEISAFAYFLFQSIPNPETLNWFDQYGPLSIAALAIITNFYFLRMNHNREMARDEQATQREKAQTEALKMMAMAMREAAEAVSENSKEVAVVKSIVERLPR